MLAQTALELLTWAYFELEKEWTDDRLELLKHEAAFDSIVRLLNDLALPTEVPASPPELRELAAAIRDAGNEPIRNGPELITRVRNWVVHPRRRARRQLRPVSSRARRAVRELALWYVELVLLRLLSYEGHYMNRLQLPSVRMNSEELVPWTKARV